jgi:MFS family permease
MSYLIFVLKERRLLSFGLSLTFFSSFGQTFLIALFVPYFLHTFELSNAAFGSIYSVATLASALALPWLGQYIDRMPIRKYSMFVAVGLVAACLLVAISTNIAVLFLGIMILRLAGQGLSGHTAHTAMARYYDHQRGKALSVSSLGYPIGEGILPILIAGLLAVVHWRTAWGIIALMVAVILIPLLFRLVGRTEQEREIPLKKEESAGAIHQYIAIMREPLFYYITPAMLMPPFWVTGLFLYQISIADDFGWSTALIASAFMAFAGSRIVFSILVGPWIDRFTARRLYPFYLLPMILAMMVPIFWSGSGSAFLYMILLGVALGISGNIKSALFAELYGTEMLGTVRSLFGTAMIIATALSPFIFGFLLDLHTPLENILWMGIITSLLAGGLSLKVLRE